MSTSTGPGRPVRAMWNASRSVSASWFASLTRKLCLVIGIVIPVMSASWKASLPTTGVGTWPVIATIGTESIFASASAVTRLHPPGPEVAIATPTLPVAHAYPSAAWPAPCSWRHRTWRTFDSISGS